jgi:hypothetical protein
MEQARDLPVCQLRGQERRRVIDPAGRQAAMAMSCAVVSIWGHCGGRP